MAQLDELVAAGRFGEARAWILATAPPGRGASGGTWGDRCRSIVYYVLEHTKGWPANERRRAFRDAYPFGARMDHPYKAWLREVAIATGRRVRFARRANRSDQTGSLFA